jgi:hypothetical protein
MSPTTVDPGKHNTAANIFRIIGVLLAILLLGFGALMISNFGDRGELWSALRRGEIRELSEAKLHGPPLRTSQGGADRIYLLTTQDETIAKVSLRGNRDNSTRRMMHVDLWAIDPATMKPAWCKRLATFENKQLEGFDLRRIDLLGADGKTLWLLIGEPMAVSLVDGEKIADGAAIDKRNPRLAGKQVNQMGYVAFGRHGLQLTIDDSTQWRIDGQTLEAQPRDTPARDPKAIIAPAKLEPTSHSFQVRSLPIPGRWLGVLTDREAEDLQKKPVIPGRDPDERPGVMQEFLEANHVPQDLTEEPQQYRLWGARVEQVSAGPADWPKELPNKWGTRPKFSDYKVLPEAPSFLTAGLLREFADNEQPLWYTEPDSVVVLHHDKLGEAGRLKLARVSGPVGKLVWDVPLGVADLQAVMRDRRIDLVLLGTEPVAVARDAKPGPGMDPDAQLTEDEHVKLVRVSISDGSTKSFDLTAESVRVGGED